MLCPHLENILTANLYGGLHPSAETIANFYRQSGKPFIVTEFFAKATDAIDANGFALANSTGSGVLVRRQEDRATYFEHYVLKLIESGACVGWTWYRYRDNDPSLYRAVEGGPLLSMYDVDYHARTGRYYRDAEGRLVSASEAGELAIVYCGEPIASNQNVNKGFYNADFSSAVTVYTSREGILLYSRTCKVKDPVKADMACGSVLETPSGERFTLGRIRRGERIEETVLSVYRGRYLALTHAVADISRHLVGLLAFFENEN